MYSNTERQPFLVLGPYSPQCLEISSASSESSSGSAYAEMKRCDLSLSTIHLSMAPLQPNAPLFVPKARRSGAYNIINLPVPQSRPLNTGSSGPQRFKMSSVSHHEIPPTSPHEPDTTVDWVAYESSLSDDGQAFTESTVERSDGYISDHRTAQMEREPPIPLLGESLGCVAGALEVPRLLDRDMVLVSHGGGRLRSRHHTYCATERSIASAAGL